MKSNWVYFTIASNKTWVFSIVNHDQDSTELARGGQQITPLDRKCKDRWNHVILRDLCIDNIVKK
ncbi:hypothetical protein C5167_029704 [Papaver somniferum]|nr:hypothetical protein C5167_029704 [Papaver somniferum]